jgi:hypothetical protein
MNPRITPEMSSMAPTETAIPSQKRTLIKISAIVGHLRFTTFSPDFAGTFKQLLQW